MDRAKFLTKNAEKIRRLKAQDLSQIINDRDQINGGNSGPGVPDDVRRSADEIIQRSREFRFFKNYQGFTKHEAGNWYHLIHSPDYNAEEFKRDVEYLDAESGEAVRVAQAASKTVWWKSGVFWTIAAICGAIIAWVVPKILDHYFPDK